MKKKSRVKNQRVKRAGPTLSTPCLVGAALLVGAGLASAEDKKDTSNFEGGSGNNWVELSAGGMLSSGGNAQAEQSRRVPNSAFGGIEGLHSKGRPGRDVLARWRAITTTTITD